jgi:hypothetical protein
MDVPDKLALIKLFQQNKSAVDIYAALEDEELRVEWIKDQIGNF